MSLIKNIEHERAKVAWDIINKVDREKEKPFKTIMAEEKLVNKKII